VAQAIIRRLKPTTGKLAQKDLNGVAVIVPDDEYWGGFCCDLSTYEPEVARLIDWFANKDTLFIDCGANIGL
jgi:hypothetical protein